MMNTTQTTRFFGCVLADRQSKHVTVDSISYPTSWSVERILLDLADDLLPYEVVELQRAHIWAGKVD